jgi:hypothetical protein
MVHALEECRRVLVPDGLLVDLRPIFSRPAIEVICGNTVYIPGRVDDEGAIADDMAAHEAMAEAVRRGYFSPVAENSFTYADYWDTLDELLAYAAERWADFACISPFVEQAARRCIAAAPGACRIRVRRTMHLAVYRGQAAS